jgi:hypothetical protein
MPIKFKAVEIDGKKYAELHDDSIVMLDEDGTEIKYAESVISRLSTEAKGHRKRAEAAEAKAQEIDSKLKLFEGIEDPEAARKAIEFQKNVSDGQYIAAGKAEEMKAGLTRTFDEKYAASIKANAQRVKELEEKLADVSGRYDQEVVGNAFANSKYIREKTAVPLKMLLKTFEGQFKNEGGTVVARHADGQPIMAATGEVAAFDEAIQRIIEAFPDKDMILKGANNSGSGARQSNGAGGFGGKTMRASEFNALPLMQQARLMSSKEPPTLVDE